MAKANLNLERPSVPWLQCLQNNRTLSMALIASLATNAALAFAIVWILPLKETIPVFIEFQTGGNNFVKIAPAGGNYRSDEMVISSTLRRYIMDREPITKVDEYDRYRRVAAMSTANVLSAFKNAYGGKTSLVNKDGFKRAVHVVRDTAIGNGVHQIEFVTIDKIDGEIGEHRGEWVATISYEFREQKVKYDDRLLNPLGLFVDEYTVSRRDVK